MDASKWATQYMKKQGWSEGGGIGKTLQGRSDIVKVKNFKSFKSFVTVIKENSE